MEWLLIIDNSGTSGGRNNGFYVTRHLTFEAAHAALESYVQRNWKSEMPNCADNEPDVYDYFADVDEKYSIEVMPLPEVKA